MIDQTLMMPESSTCLLKQSLGTSNCQRKRHNIAKKEKCAEDCENFSIQRIAKILIKNETIENENNPVRNKSTL